MSHKGLEIRVGSHALRRMSLSQRLNEVEKDEELNDLKYHFANINLVPFV